MKFTQRPVALVASLAAILTLSLAATPEEKPTAQYDEKGDLLRPTDYRDWEFLSAGYGMNYTPTPGSHELFTNVFVPRWAYKEFLSTGKWPEQTIFVIDEREAQSKGSINKTGHFQTDLAGLAVEVKDSKRSPDTWAYYGFGTDDKTSKAADKGNNCFKCHDEHAAVEHSFVQFYPTLLPIAKSKGMLKAEYLKESSAN